MTLLVFAAHPDDEIIGCGGTIAKYVQKGRKVVIVIFSHGEGSDPLKDPKIVTERRIKESLRASAVLGVKTVLFLGLSDLKFVSQLSKQATVKQVEAILRKYEPKVIFTHTMDDPHPAHRAVTNLIKKLSEKIKPKPQVYTFAISSPFRLFQRELPRLYVDVSQTFKLKEKALKMFKSQKTWLSMYYRPLLLLKSWMAGFKSGCKYAEVFYKW